MKKKILAAMLAACVVTAIPAGIGTATSVEGGIVQAVSAKDMVEEKKIDFFKLNAVIEKAEAKFQDDEYGIIYTEDSLNALKEALIDAGYVRNNKDATQTEVDAAANKLDAALAGLKVESAPESDKAVDLSELNAAIEKAEAKFEDDEYGIIYTEESLNALKEALIDAGYVRNNKDATQTEVDAAADKLNAALAGLEIVSTPGTGGDEEDPDDDNPSENPGDEDVVVRPSYPSYNVSVPQETLDGWKHYSSGTFYYYDGVRARGFAVIDGETYYFNRQGFMQTGWVWVDDDEHQGWWYFDEDGKMVTGWLRLGNTWYYLDTVSGRMYDNGLAQIDGQTYYFYDWGGMASDWWCEAEDGWYFFGGSGAMKAAQWLEWKGDWYYLTEAGKMAADTYIGEYYVDADGVWVK